MKHLLWLLLMLPAILIAQNNQKTEDISKTKGQGVVFEKLGNWQQVLEKAKTENKYIFVDAYTTWCGPCIFMTSKIFPQKEVGDFFNKHFINVKIQLDTTEKDNEHVKKWYQDGHDMMTTYDIHAFPTFLVFDASGNLVHKMIGASEEASNFIERSTAALNPDKQYYTLLRKYNAGDKSKDLLKHFARAALDANDMDNGRQSFNEYIALQDEIYTKENIQLIEDLTYSTSDKAFKYIFEQPTRYDSLLGKPGAAERKINELVLYSEVSPMLRQSDKPDLKAIESYLAEKYPLYAEAMIGRVKITLYEEKEDWVNFQNSLVAYMSKFGHQMSDMEVNNHAWNIFLHTTDKVILEQALAWSKKTFAKDNNPMYIDTYANLLYKLGNKKEAIEWQEKAVSLVGEDEKKQYEKTLNKMKKGVKTW